MMLLLKAQLDTKSASDAKQQEIYLTNFGVAIDK